MLDPFLQPMQSDKMRRTSLPALEEATAQIYGHSLDTATPRPNVGLWVGKLLIKMGEKLAKQDHELKTIRENK